MKKNSKNTIKLGIFVALGFLLLVAGIYFVGIRQHLFSSTFRLSCIFSNINGLQVGSNVRFCGINIGIIEEIQQVSDSTVQVDMQIEERSRKFIKQNALATISRATLFPVYESSGFSLSFHGDFYAVNRSECYEVLA